jgi:tRNA1(Val) A37 N6-methylase TrmN6
MKFDVIVGNPPYQAAVEQNGQRGSRTHIWHKFVNKSLKMIKDSKPMW